MRTSCLNEIIIAKYLNDTCSEKEKAFVQKHLCECDFCFHKLAATNRIINDEKIHSLLDVAAPDDKVQHVLDSLQKKGTLDLFDSAVNKIKSSLNRLNTNILNGIRELQFSIQQKFEPGYQFVLVRNDNKKINTPNKMIKKINNMIVEFMLISTEKDNMTIQIHFLKFKKWENARFFVIQKGHGMIASLKVKKDPILLKDLSKADYTLIIKKIEHIVDITSMDTQQQESERNDYMFYEQETNDMLTDDKNISITFTLHDGGIDVR